MSASTDDDIRDGWAVMLDIKEMPGYNPAVTNGIDSVSKGLCKLSKGGWKDRSGLIKEHRRLGILMLPWEGRSPLSRHPECHRHGAMLRVSRDGIYRCGEPGCDVGCYYHKEETL